MVTVCFAGFLRVAAQPTDVPSTVANQDVENSTISDNKTSLDGNGVVTSPSSPLPSLGTAIAIPMDPRLTIPPSGAGAQDPQIATTPADNSHRRKRSPQLYNTMMSPFYYRLPYSSLSINGAMYQGSMYPYMG